MKIAVAMSGGVDSSTIAVMLQQQGHELIGLSFSVAGTYTNLRAFLADLERSLRIVDVRALSFTAGDKDSNEYSIELDTYWFKS